MITAVMLHWDRPQNLGPILRAWDASPQITEVLVWNNNPAHGSFLDAAPRGLRRPTTFIASSADCGLGSRFAAGCLARAECVLIQDDDLVLPPETVAALHAAWARRPQHIHGLFGRTSRPDGSYGRVVRAPARGVPARAPIVLTRALMIDRRWLGAYFLDLRPFRDLLARGEPRDNGEDIVLSYVVRRRLRAGAAGHAPGDDLHFVHALPSVPLDDAGAICARWPRHLAHRTEVQRACEAWLGAARHAAALAR